MKKARLTLSVACAALLSTSATWAATLEPAQGDLVINQGQGFQPVNSRVDANVGDSVMVGPGGSASVVYSDGCTVNVQPGAVTTIAPISPCASGSYAAAADPYDPWATTALVLGAGALAVGGVALAERKPTSNVSLNVPNTITLAGGLTLTLQCAPSMISPTTGLCEIAVSP